jgi:hypothetical protein
MQGSLDLRRNLGLICGGVFEGVVKGRIMKGDSVICLSWIFVDVD